MDWTAHLTSEDIDGLCVLQDNRPLYPVEVIMMSGSTAAGFTMFAEHGPLPEPRAERRMY